MKRIIFKPLYAVLFITLCMAGCRKELNPSKHGGEWSKPGEAGKSIKELVYELRALTTKHRSSAGFL